MGTRESENYSVAASPFILFYSISRCYLYTTYHEQIPLKVRTESEIYTKTELGELYPFSAYFYYRPISTLIMNYSFHKVFLTVPK